MRIIGGELGGRKINPPSKMPHTRPTTDIAKEDYSTFSKIILLSKESKRWIFLVAQVPSVMNSHPGVLGISRLSRKITRCMSS